MKGRIEKAREIKKVSIMDDDGKKMMRNMKKELLMADTSEIARQVKDRLHSSGISQKVRFYFSCKYCKLSVDSFIRLCLYLLCLLLFCHYLHFFCS